MAEFFRSKSLPYLEVRRSCQDNSCYRPHTHDCFSIGIIDEGTSILSGPLEGKIKLLAGDLVLIPANYVHDCNPGSEKWVYQMIHMEQDWVDSLVLNEHSSHLFDRINVIRDVSVYRKVVAWAAMLFDSEGEEQIKLETQTILEILDTTPTEYSVEAEVDARLLSHLSPVFEILLTEENNISLDTLAATVGMTKYQLVRSVKKTTGLTPMAWRQNARVTSARRMLREGTSIAETAHMLGFVDQSHFHRVFRSYVAATPGGYIKQTQ